MSIEREVIIKLEGVSKTFTLREEEGGSLKGKIFNLFSRQKNRSLKALDNVSLDIYKGECFGLVGRNGSGKTTLTKVISGAYKPDEGGIVVKKGSSMLLNLGLGMSHELSARENIYITCALLGLRKVQTDEIFNQIINFSELKEFTETKIKFFSSGMRQRLAFAIAVHAKAEIIILDEVFAVGDEKFREKAILVFEQAFIEGRTVIMVTHSLQNIRKYCQRAALIHHGKIIMIDEPNIVVDTYNKLP